MANLHLIQALYAPKPPTPTVKLEDPALEEGEVRQQDETAASEQSIHDARWRLMESEEPTEVNYEVPARWEPTGANMQPVGIKSESPEPGSDAHMRGFPSVRRNDPPAPFPLPPTTRPHGLMYPVERYLPPAGIYYDQLVLLAIFGAPFFKPESCKICWRGQIGAGVSRTFCPKKCQVCGTQRHKDESCPLLYCNVRWYHAHNIPYLPETLRSRQIRPDDQELAILCNMGVISETRGANGIIIANPYHPIVQAFYEGRPSPKGMTGMIVNAARKPRSVFITTADGSSFIPNIQSQQPLPPPMRPYSLSEMTVNSNLDPRLRGRNTDPGPSKATQPEIATEYDHATPTDPQDAEEKLHEQEIEILKLRMEAIVKDREIRKLKTENETLKAENEKIRVHPVNTGGTYETGSKRPRL